MFKIFFFFSSFFFSVILCEHSYTLSDDKNITESLNENNKLSIKVKYNGNKKYISLKVQSDEYFPCILFCKSQKCNNRNDANLVSDKLLISQNLFVEKSDLLNNFGYFTIYTKEDQFKGTIIIQSTEHIMIQRNESYSFFVEKVDFLNTFEIPRFTNENENENAVMTFSINTPFKCEFSCIYKINNEEINLEDSIHFEQGYILTFREPEPKKDAKYICNVKNKEADNFIIFTSKKYNGTNMTQLYNFHPNSKAVEGMLKKGLLDEECYMTVPLKRIDDNANFSLSLTLFKGKAFISLGNSSNKTIKEYRLNSYNNEFSIDYKIFYGQNTYFCVKKEENSTEDVIYSVQLIDLFSDLRRGDFYSPQMHSIFYKRETPGRKVIFFYHTQRNQKKDDFTYFYMRLIRGNAVMYLITCLDFPNCNYNIENVDKIKNDDEIYNVNNIFYGKFPSSNEKSPISSIQNIFIVACKSQRSCIYETLIFNSQDEIRLKPFLRFSKFSKAKEYDVFKFKVDEKKIEKVIVALYSISGDVKLTILNENEIRKKITIKRNFFINKQEIIYSSLQSNIYEFRVMVTAMKNSFYSIEYRIVKEGDNKVQLLQGASYLETIKDEEIKSIYIMHYTRNRTNSCFQVFFYGLNCKCRIEREQYNSSTKVIIKNNYLGFDIISNNNEIKDEDYKIQLLKYKVKMESMDNIVQYDSIPCMIYISSIDNSYNPKQQTNSSYRDRDLLISENINYNIKINKKNKGMRFVYPHTNRSQNIFIQFNKEDKEELYINIFINNKLIYDKIIISYTRMLILEKVKFSDICSTKDLCKVLLDISPNNDIGDFEINFSFTLKTEDKTPIYLKKGLMKIDTIPGNSIIFYYTDIGKDEEGEVIVNFDRGNGRVYGKLVKKTVEDKNIADWMGFINFPKKKDPDLLSFEIDAKKIIYTSQNTEICNIGCFLLITVENPIDSFMYEKMLYDISLIVRVTKYELYESQYIEIIPDKFVVGKLYPKEIGDGIYHYYNFKIPKDTESILIEQQNDIYDIYVKKGISIDEKSQKYVPTGYYNVYEIKKTNETYKKGEYISMKIGINMIYHYFKTTYIFRVRIPEKEIDLIPVNSDQNTFCKYNSSTKMCYYVIFNPGLDTKFYIHAYQNTLSSNLNLYISIIPEKYIINNDIENINKSLPSKKSNSSENNLRSDTYVGHINKGENILVGVDSNKNGVITLLTSFQKSLKSLNVDSSKYQLIYLDQNDQINLTFPSNDVFMIKFVSIEGSGKIKIGNSIEQQFELKSNHDFFTAITSLNNTPIIIEADYILGFYVFYDYRGDINFEEIEFGTSGQFYYDESKFFLIYYCKIPEKIEDVDIIINIKNYYIKGEKYKTDIVENNKLKAYGMIIEYALIINKKKQPNINPNDKPIEGEFDVSLQIMKLKFNKTFIDSIKKNNSYFYITVQNDNLNMEFKTILTECSVFPSKINEILAPYNQYYFGNLTSENKTRAIFKLKKNIIGDKFMKIEFSTNNQKVKFAFSEKKFGNDEIKDDKKFEKIEKNGKIYGILQLNDNINELYLYVYSNDNPGPNQFTFKYSTSMENNFYDFDFNNRKIVCKKNEKEKKLELKIGKVISQKLTVKIIPVTYYVRVILSEELNKLKLTPNTITFLNVNTKKVYKKYSNGDENEINMILDDFPNDNKYDIIIIAITQEPIFEMLFYEYIKNPFEYGTISLSRYIYIFIIVGLVVLFIILFLKYYRMNKENTDYKKQIDQLSLVCGTNADNQINNNEPEIGYNALKF